jgi:enamine deaminase RidA (YjgF/YER057c/UK114 family)
MDILLPDGWKRPPGYSNGIAVTAKPGDKTIFVAGQIGWLPGEGFVAHDFAGQFAQALDNILAVLAEGGAGAEHITRMTWYITDRDAYMASLKEMGAAFRAAMGKNYPVMSVIIVAGLVEEQALLEIETTAVVPA